APDSHDDAALAESIVRDAAAPVRGPNLPDPAVPHEQPAPLLVELSTPQQVAPGRVAEPDVGRAARPSEASRIERATAITLATPAPASMQAQVRPVSAFIADA